MWPRDDSVPWHASFANGVFVFVEPCADLRQLRRRLFYAEDVGMAAVTSAVASVAPRSAAMCTGVAAAVLLVALLHLGYVAGLRPYRTRRDQLFATLWAANAAVMGAIAVVATRASDGRPSAVLWAALDATLMVQSAAFFVQPAVEVGLWVVKRRWRRRTRVVLTDRRGGEGDGDAVAMDDVANPLLTVPTVTSPAAASDGTPAMHRGAAAGTRNATAVPEQQRQRHTVASGTGTGDTSWVAKQRNPLLQHHNARTAK